MGYVHEDEISAAMSDEDYVEAKELVCPFCRSRKLQHDEDFEEGPKEGTIMSNVTCNGCQRTWQSRFKLVGWN